MARPLTRRAALPEWIRPQLTQLVDAAPEGDPWLHEIKFDGYRMHARLDRGAVRLLTRTDEMTVLRTAHAYETATSWRHRRPSLDPGATFSTEPPPGCDAA
jgi:hypothetical protein